LFLLKQNNYFKIMSKTSNHAKLACLEGWLKTLKPRPKPKPVLTFWDKLEDEEEKTYQVRRTFSKRSR
jgi:hypothetical protein